MYVCGHGGTRPYISYPRSNYVYAIPLESCFTTDHARVLVVVEDGKVNENRGRTNHGIASVKGDATARKNTMRVHNEVISSS